MRAEINYVMRVHQKRVFAFDSYDLYFYVNMKLRCLDTHTHTLSLSLSLIIVLCTCRSRTSAEIGLSLPECLRPNVHTFLPKIYAIVLIFNTIYLEQVGWIVCTLGRRACNTSSLPVNSSKGKPSMFDVVSSLQRRKAVSVQRWVSWPARSGSLNVSTSTYMTYFLYLIFQIGASVYRALPTVSIDIAVWWFSILPPLNV